MKHVVANLLSKDHSVATGLLIALAVWTLTRLVDGVTGTGTIEYDTQYSTITQDGKPVSRVEVTLTNLSCPRLNWNAQGSTGSPRLAPLSKRRLDVP